ncbi:hypothetical protein BG006_000415, partial [Podila minutissima]
PTETRIDIEAPQSSGSGNNVTPPAENESVNVVPTEAPQHPGSDSRSETSARSAHVDDGEETDDEDATLGCRDLPACQNNTAPPLDTIKVYDAAKSGSPFTISTLDKVNFAIHDGCYTVVLCLDIDTDPQKLENLERILVGWREKDYDITGLQDFDTVITKDNILSNISLVLLVT